MILVHSTQVLLARSPGSLLHGRPGSAGAKKSTALLVLLAGDTGRASYRALRILYEWRNVNARGSAARVPSIYVGICFWIFRFFNFPDFSLFSHAF